MTLLIQLPLYMLRACCVIIIKMPILYLHFDQVPVFAMDHPLYFSAKQIKLTWPELGEELFVGMLGGLHIEMAMLTMLGKWIEESDWSSSAIAKAGIVTSGRAEAISHKANLLYAAAFFCIFFS